MMRPEPEQDIGDPACGTGGSVSVEEALKGQSAE